MAETLEELAKKEELAELETDEKGNIFNSKTKELLEGLKGISIKSYTDFKNYVVNAYGYLSTNNGLILYYYPI